MLYSVKVDAQEEEFISLLEATKIAMLRDMASGFKPKDGLEFQDFTLRAMVKAATSTQFEGTIRQSGPHGFPDIIAKKYFGVEVKMASSDKWTSLGNSILESTRAEDVERIYMFFGKITERPDIKYRRYQDCLKHISVTHSPRYGIDMELAPGESIFTKMGIDYDVLRRNENPVRVIKSYYRAQLKKGEELWWIDAGTEQATSPIIKPFRLLEEGEKERFRFEAMILFPEIFGSSRTKYERAAAYLTVHYNVVCSNMRDIFTAGGQVEVEINGANEKVPQLYSSLYTEAEKITKYIAEIPDEDVLHYWDLSDLPSDRISTWKSLLSKKKVKSSNLTPLAIFEAGYAKNKESSR